MAHSNKKCLACGQKYAYCPDCSRADALAPSWKSEFCSEDCMTLWTTATKYNLNKLAKQEAKKIISALNLKSTEQYVACVQRDLAVILAEEKKPRRNKKVEEKIDAEEEQIVVDVVADIKDLTEDNVVVEVTIPGAEEPITHEVVYKTEELIKAL